MGSRLWKAGVSGLFVARVCGLTASVAGAAEPAQHACVGVTFSDGAAALPGGDLGQLVAGFARDDDGAAGLGNGIQAIQAGQLPDEVAVNACN